MKQTLILVTVAIGCGTEDPTTRTAVADVEVLAHDCDGNLSSEDKVDSFAPNTGGLHVIGIGQARYDDPYGLHPECWDCLRDITCDIDAVCGKYDGWDPFRAEPATVHVGRGVTTLVLASPLATEWTVTADPDTDLQRVIVSGIEGYNDSTVVVPDGVIAERHHGFGYAYVHYTAAELELTCEDVYGAAGLPGYCRNPYFVAWWLEDRQQNAVATTEFLAAAERAAGEKLGSFRGCLEMKSMWIGVRDPEADRDPATSGDVPTGDSQRVPDDDRR